MPDITSPSDTFEQTWQHFLRWTMMHERKETNCLVLVDYGAWAAITHLAGDLAVHQSVETMAVTIYGYRVQMWESADLSDKLIAFGLFRSNYKHVFPLLTAQTISEFRDFISRHRDPFSPSGFRFRSNHEPA